MATVKNRLELDSFEESMLKEMHSAETGIEAVAAKIANADDADTYPSDYAAMRSEQEQHRQQALKCWSAINRKAQE